MASLTVGTGSAGLGVVRLPACFR